LKELIDKFTLDSLQIFFPWDDDLYTYLRKLGFGKEKAVALPLVYTDNTESTINQKESRRRFVIHPDKFGKTYKELGWKETDKKSEPIIPAEKPQVEIWLDKEKQVIIFRFITTINGKEEYHLEYSTMSAFGKLYSNWVNFYFTINDFRNLIEKLEKYIQLKEELMPKFHVEPQQNQREKLIFLFLDVLYYKFCLSVFKYMVGYLKKNGVKSDLPCLEYDSSDKELKKIMEPKLKLGFVHTTKETGFEERKIQIALKLSQDKMIINQRKKKAKVKGKIIHEKSHENIVIVNAIDFLSKSEAVLDKIEEEIEVKKITDFA